MLQIELTTQLRRLRSLLVYGGLAAIIIIAGLTEASKAGGKGGPATFSALNFTEAGLNFLDPVLLGLVIALLGSVIGGSDRDWGTLRYLYVRPVSRARLVTGKWWALVVCCALAMIVYLGFSLVTGLTSAPAGTWLPRRAALAGPTRGPGAFAHTRPMILLMSPPVPIMKPGRVPPRIQPGALAPPIIHR